MRLLETLILCLAALLIGALAPNRWRKWLLLFFSLVSIYWLQPVLPIPRLDFWLPTLSIALAVLIWAATQPASLPAARETWVSAGFVAGTLLILGIQRYLGQACCLTPSRPPSLLQILLAISLVMGLAALCWRWLRLHPRRLAVFAAALLILFLVLKTEPLSAWLSSLLRSISGRSAASASGQEIRWLGFSYIAFRLLHVLRDRQSGRLPEFALQEFLIYIFFFPALAAGPIDRSPRFIQELRKEFKLTPAQVWSSLQRIGWGVFRKFVLADSLAVIALNETTASQAGSTFWLWVLLIAYALRIYLDFAGYTDIAIGAGQLVGIKLPENFERPYLKPDLGAFWNSWHITLAQWFRAYFFNPVTRSMRSGKHPLPMPAIILVGQIGTMILIGLWHGVTWNFFIWGAWHGVGLFVHNRWSEFQKARQAGSEKKPQPNRLGKIAGTAITFFFVSLGWVWFALPEPALSWIVLLGLFGYGQ